MADKKHSPTKAQQNAIDVRGCDVLVSAAAGSGKTSTLTEKIIRMIKGDETHEPMDIGRMLIVTFTRSAAAGLKDKITAALTNAIKAQLEDAENTSDTVISHLNRQLLAVSSADICTIDSFYETPVRQNFEKLGLPAAMRHAVDEEIYPLCRNVMEQIIAGRYENGGDADFIRFADSVTSARDSNSLADTLIKLYNSTGSLPEGHSRLRECADRFLKDADLPTGETLCGKIIINKLSSFLGHVTAAYKSFLETLNNCDEFAEKLYGFLEEEYTALCLIPPMLTNSSYADIFTAIFNVKGTRITPAKNIPTEIYEQIKNARSAIWDGFKSMQNSLTDFTDERIKSEYREIAAMCNSVADVLDEYEKQLSAEKTQRGICTFNDMAHFMLRLLQSPDGTPTELADGMADKYDIVCIDEYQDVNEIQDGIFKLIGRNRRFMVGDIKQSIYGFRYAEPDIFAGYKRGMPEFTTADAQYPNGCGIFMSENFRCDENVIKFTNSVCNYTFGACADVIDYNAGKDALIFGKSKPNDEYVSPKVELNFVENCGDADYIQANVTADRIAELLNGGRLSDGRAIKPEDVVILVRSMPGTKSLIKALEERNIKLNTDNAEAISESPITKYVISLLDVINNPHGDVFLSEMLTSDYFAYKIPLDDLLTVRNTAKNAHSLYDAICEISQTSDGAISEKCSKAVAYIEKYRDASVTESADKLLKKISSDYDSASFASSDEFTAIYDLACAFVKNAWNGLYGFLHFYHSTGFKGDSYEFSAKPGRVSLITMHKSKGLEFPVTVLYNVGKEFNETDLKKPLIFEKSIGLGVDFKDENANIKTESFVKFACKEQIKKKTCEEEMRILYVAMTRAQERLIICGKLKNTFGVDTAKSDAGGGSYSVYKANKHITWILNSLKYADSDAYTLNIHNQYTSAPIKYGASADDAEKPTPDAGLYSDIIAEAPEITANSLLLASVPVKAAASHLKPGMLESCFISVAEKLDSTQSDEKNPDMLEIDTPELIKRRIELMRSESKGDFEMLMSANKKPTAADRGIAIHKFLQFCDYSRARSGGVESEIEYLLEHKFIDIRTADNINRRQADAFLHSEFFGLIQRAEKIRREFKFNLFLPLSDFISNNDKLKELVGDRTIYIQGSIDLLLEMPDGKLILCDYKSDFIPKEITDDSEKLRQFLQTSHGTQLEQYSKAVEASFGRKPDETYIYSTVLGEAIIL